MTFVTASITAARQQTATIPWLNSILSEGGAAEQSVERRAVGQWPAFGRRPVGKYVPIGVRGIVARRTAHVHDRHDFITIGFVDARNTSAGEMAARQTSPDAHAVWIRQILASQSLLNPHAVTLRPEIGLTG